MNKAKVKLMEFIDEFGESINGINWAIAAWAETFMPAPSHSALFSSFWVVLPNGQLKEEKEELTADGATKEAIDEEWINWWPALQSTNKLI